MQRDEDGTNLSSWPDGYSLLDFLCRTLSTVLPGKLLIHGVIVGNL